MLKVKGLEGQALPPRWVMVSWTILILSLMALIRWAGQDGLRRQEVNARTVFSAQTDLPSTDLAHCLMRELPLTGHWTAISETPEHDQAWNPARHLRADIEAVGNQWRVSIATPLGRPLRDQEAEALRQCLAPGQSAG